MTGSPNKRCSRHCKATEEEDDQGAPGKEILTAKCGQQASGSAGRRWRRQRKTELDGNMLLWETQGISQVKAR